MLGTLLAPLATVAQRTVMDPLTSVYGTLGLRTPLSRWIFTAIAAYMTFDWVKPQTMYYGNMKRAFSFFQDYDKYYQNGVPPTPLSTEVASAIIATAAASLS